MPITLPDVPSAAETEQMIAKAKEMVEDAIKTQQADKAADGGTSQSAVANDVPAAPEIESADDLDKASATLDDINLDDNGDQSQLDSELSAF